MKRVKGTVERKGWWDFINGVETFNGRHSHEMALFSTQIHNAFQGKKRLLY